MTPPQIPSLSREVHFVLPNGQHRTAKVINTNTDHPNQPTLKVDLDPFTDTLSLDEVIRLGESVKITANQLYARNVPHDESGTAVGSWHWTERV